MENLLWEIKSPKGNSSRTIENNFRAALRQSENIIFDLTKFSLPKERALAKIKYEFRMIKTAKKVSIITKTKEIIDITR